MTDISDAIRRLELALDSRPGFGSHTARATSTVTGGLRCTTVEDAWTIASDVSQPLGGSASAPSPSALVRAALGSCLAIGYAMRAARHGIELDSVTVTVETEGTIAGMLLCDSTEPAGFRSISYHVEVASSSRHEDVMRIVDEGDRLSPLLDVLRRDHDLRRTVVVTPGVPS